MLHAAAEALPRGALDTADYQQQHAACATEAVAYVLASLLGLDPDASSISYLAGWSHAEPTILTCGRDQRPARDQRHRRRHRPRRRRRRPRQRDGERGLTSRRGRALSALGCDTRPAPGVRFEALARKLALELLTTGSSRAKP
jgi:hypothetical protein